MTTSPDSRRAHVVGLGLIGASVALALGEAGWRVSGSDLRPAVVDEARRRGVIDDGAFGDEHSLVVIATPAGTVAALAEEHLHASARADLVVTDVAGVKGAITAAVSDPRFIGGHPMAGSEQRGLAGARPDLFRGCTWVLTPTASTAPAAYSGLHGILRELGASVVAISGEDHDRLVALASHVPHLLAGALMNEATQAAEEDPVLLQLAAGGFRDMTRIAAGDPAIWPDVLFENHAAVTATHDALGSRLDALRDALVEGRREALVASLQSASVARRQLPGRALSSDNLAYLRVVVSDRPGELATVTMTASELLVNIYDIEIAHGIEGAGGTLLLAVDATQVLLFQAALADLGYRVAREQ